MLRPELPNVPDGAAGKSATLNHASTVSGPAPLPVLFGRPVMLIPTLLLPCTTVKGRPVRYVKIPLSVHPPRIAPPAPLFAHFFPSPKGSSATKFVTTRWRMSKSLGPSQAERLLPSWGKLTGVPRCSPLWSVDFPRV